MYSFSYSELARGCFLHAFRWSVTQTVWQFATTTTVVFCLLLCHNLRLFVFFYQKPQFASSIFLKSLTAFFSTTAQERKSTPFFCFVFSTHKSDSEKQMFRHSPQRRFFKSHSHLPHSNPLRRWVHLKFGAMFLGSIASIPFVSYAWTMTMSAARDPPETFASDSVQLMMEMAPMNLLSRAIGDLAASTIVPPYLHQSVMRLLVRLYSIDMSEFEPIETYQTTQEFFCRKLHGEKHPKNARAWTHDDAELVSPVDAELLQCGEVSKEDRTMLQVKGFSYPVEGLFRMTLPPTPSDSMARMYFLFHLRPGDYHRVHSPQHMKVHKTLHVPGCLYPTTGTAMRWLPNLILTNERVLLFGEKKKHNNDNDKSTTTTKPSSSSASLQGKQQEQQEPFMGVALVGASMVGSINVSFDERILTNLAEPPEASVLRDYGPAAPHIGAGEELAYFKWGSCVVLVADVPRSSLPLAVSPGTEVKQGQKLV